LHDERFIKWKPTVLYAAMGHRRWPWRSGRAASKSFLKAHAGFSQLELPRRCLGAAQCRLDHGTALFMAAVNAYVAVYFSTEALGRLQDLGVCVPGRVSWWAQGFYISRPQA
jgi:intracellular septation protein